MNADYYITEVVTFKGMYEFPLKTFFWTLSTIPDFKFKEMQGLGLSTEDFDKLIDQMKVRKKRSKFLNVL